MVSNLKVIKIKVEGIDCQECAAPIEKKLRNIRGIKDVKVNFIAERVTITYDEKETKPEEIEKAIRNLGYKVQKATSQE